MLRRIFIGLFLLSCFIVGAIAEDLLPSEIQTGTDKALNNVMRKEALTTSLNADALWDTTSTVDAGWANRLRITDYISAGYFLRAIVIYTSNDAEIHMYGDGINCKYAAADSASGYLRAGKSIALEFNVNSAIVDSFAVEVDNDDTVVDVWVLAARPKSTAP